MKMKPMLVALLALIMVPLAAYGGDYVIGDGDTLMISVWGVKELTLSVKVRPDGKVTLPALGDVVATGFTPTELQAALTEKLKSLVRNPIVTVIVEGITNSKVYVFGGGVKPGVYELTRRTSLLQLLCTIGDIKVADLRRAYVLRNGAKVKEDFAKLFVDGDVTEDITIETNDVIFIPAYLERNIYVAGAVNSPRFIEHRDGLTIMDAILEAGWFTKFAKENDVIIFRKEGKGGTTSIPVKVRDLVRDGDLSQNIKLKPGDYIIVKEGIF
ncbi:MAG: polysaccharide biosynthesis/export family protein [Nitrospirota bacterium]